ncbi:hypothetical protein AWB78_08572 [Caballeronia calidae]|uniref:Uncharacterized protein n=1 Tax=Caballeronia calidae TaxID=1777139 RepID=A0A158EKU2_9BURK|nr:hypothetical protein AWB78_08572 [Caballeronia calidae]
MFLAPVARQRAHDIILAALDPAVTMARKDLRIALARDDCTDDRLPRHAHHIREHFGELQVHLHQRLLHAQHPTGLFGQQHLALAHHRAHHADLVIRPPGGPQQPQAHEPLAILHVALAPRHILHLPCVDQPDCQPTLLQHLIHRNPEYAGQFQGDRVDPAREQPVGHRVQVIGHRAEFPNGLISGPVGHRDPVTRTAHINARCVRKYLGALFALAHRHRQLHTCSLNGSAMGCVEIDSIS